MRILLIALTSLVPSVALAYVIEIGEPVGKVEAEMKAANYEATNLQVLQPKDLRIDHWAIDSGILHVVTSLETNKVTGIWFETTGSRPKAEPKNMFLQVKRFDTSNGEMLIQTKRKWSEAEAAEFRRFDRKWNVGSAGFQMGGPITYTFDNGNLVIESRTRRNGKEGGDGPVMVSIERYRYRLDIIRIPKQIFLTPLGDNGGKEQRRIYEFRDGWLWICPDDGPTPKNSESLRNGQSGSGWLIGLVPTK